MSLVTTGAETWAPHTHRHHHAAGTTWLFGPEGPANVTGPDPVTAQPRIGDFEFLFWSAGGAQGGGLTYPGGELTPMPTPVFPADAHSGSLIAWYIDRGGNGPPPPPNLKAVTKPRTVSLTWDPAANASAYRVVRNGQRIVEIRPGTYADGVHLKTAYDDGVDLNTAYNYQVQAVHTYPFLPERIGTAVVSTKTPWMFCLPVSR